LERKGAVRISKRISNANIFEALISQAEVQGSIMDEMLKLFGGKAKPIMSHLIKTGSLTLDDIHEAEQTLRELDKKRKGVRK
jgi:predicted transcriptional regulator